MGQGPLETVLDEVARTLSQPALCTLARALDGLSTPDDETRRRVVAAVPVGAFAEEARRLVDAWRDHDPDRHGPAVALALRAATRAVASCRAEQTVDLVWTGPQTQAVPVRLTRAVLLEVIDAAQRELVLMSYAAFRVQPVLDALAEAASRGVTIKLVLESTEESAGQLTVDASRAFATVRGHVGFYVWPADQRPQVGTGQAVLHAKTAVADYHTALITSANLTEHAITSNMELGVLINGGATPRRLRDHVAELIHDGVLVEAVPASS
jgi:phosphatidylserine/phosphatidylglycerophosphate/cardiolipin synthase-like enzyme